MRQLNVPKKYTSAGQLWLNIVLIVLAAIFAFSPIVSINMEDNTLWDGVQEALDSLSEQVPEFSEIEKPEDNIGVTSGKIITSVSIVAKIVDVALSEANHDGKGQEKQEELAALIASEEGQQSIIMTVAIFSQLVDFGGEADSETESETNIGKVIQTVIKFIIIFYLLIYIAVWPFVMAIIALINVIRALKNMKTPEKTAGKVGGVLVSPFAFALTLSFVLTFLPGFEWGAGLTTVFVCSVISIVANVVLTRLRAYNPLDFKYVSLVQGAALLQGVGFIVFFVNLVKTNLLFGFFETLGQYIIDAETEIAAVNISLDAMGKEANATIGTTFLPDLLLMMLFFILALSVIGTIVAAVINRLTLTSGKKLKVNAPYSAAITAILTAVMPMVVGKLESKKTWEIEGETWIAKEAGTIFELSAENSAALTGMLVGGIIMLVAAIAFTVAKNFLCADMNEYMETAALTGRAPEYGMTESTADVVAEAPEKETENTEA